MTPFVDFAKVTYHEHLYMYVVLQSSIFIVYLYGWDKCKMVLKSTFFADNVT